MRKEINLLIASKRPKEKELQYRTLVRTGTMITIVLYTLVVLGVFSFHSLLSRKENEVIAKIEKKEREIKNQSRIESLQLAVKTRLTGLNWVFEKEKAKIGLIDSLRRIRLLTQGTSLDLVEISDFGNSVVLNGSVANITDLIKFFNKLIEIQGEKNGFDHVFVSGLNKSERKYSFHLNLTAFEPKND